jgi:Ni2+-binding GTPase involved in maturation of urease and hydrogenase
VAANKPWIVVVGGFLGSGKSSLILAAATELERRELRCAVVLNDQGDQLVDKSHADAHGMLAGAVTGGCFCCKYSSFISVIDQLQADLPDVIFAEPVGSCTDIAATVLRPLREEFDRFRVAPFTVLVDPERATGLLSNAAESDLAYLFKKQLQEADLVCMSKADLYMDAGCDSMASAIMPGVELRSLSSKTGQGVKAWLDEILFGSFYAGAKTLEIDYARYARAEAALAWLNLSFVLETRTAQSPVSIVGPFLDRIDEQLTAAGISIMHLKVFDNAPSGWLKAALCGNRAEPRVEGNLDASPSNRHELLINLRAEGEPSEVRRIVEQQLGKLEGKRVGVRLESFSPAAPKPERRVPAF